MRYIFVAYFLLGIIKVTTVNGIMNVTLPFDI